MDLKYFFIINILQKNLMKFLKNLMIRIFKHFLLEEVLKVNNIITEI